MIFMSGTRIISCFIACLLSACAYQQPVTIVSPPAAAVTTEQVQYWWRVNYRIAWPENTEPELFIDLLLADAVIEPVLLMYRDSIAYWRFHRRAVRDEAGHQFSFIFYADKSTARSIYQQLDHNKITRKMLETKILQKIITDNTDSNTLTGISATSDKNWPAALQNAWPAYIMGVSSAWLQLINQEITDDKPVYALTTLLDEYKQADIVISGLWYEQGQHAFLHHLNAMFGYQPTLVKKEPLQF